METSARRTQAVVESGHPAEPVHDLERATIGLPIDERIVRAAARLDAVGPATGSPGHVLRPDQVRVFHDFQAFLIDAATRPRDERSVAIDEARFGRIILPPRTGKTVIAAHIIACSGLCTTFLVPTRTLVVQTANELRARMPGVPVGVYFGERKELVAHGVNVATYAILQRDFGRRALPDPVARSALIFADEAHHSMTRDRLRLLQGGFSPGAVRVGLTATPDYDEDRVLCRFFPTLIHEVALEETLALGLLAPARVWVAEVDAEGSRVRILAGDYEEGSLGRAMSAAPFARAVEVFRYGRNAAMPALIACATRQQAHDLTQYLLHPTSTRICGERRALTKNCKLPRGGASAVKLLRDVDPLTRGGSSSRWIHHDRSSAPRGASRSRPAQGPQLIATLSRARVELSV